MKRTILLFSLFFFIGIYAQDNTKTAYIATPSGLNLREGPGLKHKVIVLMKYNNKVTIEKIGKKSETINNITGNWVKVKYDNYTGWTFNGYLSEEKPGRDVDTWQEFPTMIQNLRNELLKGKPWNNVEKYFQFPVTVHKIAFDLDDYFAWHEKIIIIKDFNTLQPYLSEIADHWEMEKSIVEEYSHTQLFIGTLLLPPCNVPWYGLYTMGDAVHNTAVGIKNQKVNHIVMDAEDNSFVNRKKGFWKVEGCKKY